LARELLAGALQVQADSALGEIERERDLGYSFSLNQETHALALAVGEVWADLK